MQIDLTVEELCGQLVVGGFPGPELPDQFEDALASGQRAGAILFRRNLPSLPSAHSLCRAIASAAPEELPPFIGVDEEGGRVTRLPLGTASLPAMRRLGERGDPDLVQRAGAALGALLRQLGFTVDYAPVLDVDSNPQNPVIGDRSFSSDPQAVATLGHAFASGLQSSGIMACAKHFPGHGDTDQDSHLALPHVSHDRARLDAVELLPFRALARTDLGAMMSAHVVFAALDALLPATLSRRISTRLLRRELGFDGVLFSDDLEMHALSDRLPIEQTAVQAIEAGCDALLICSDFDLQERALSALVAKADADPAFMDRCVEAAQRSLRARRRFPPSPSPALDPALVQSLQALANS